MAEQDQQYKYYSFKPISSPLTYSVRDSADSFDSDSTEASLGYTKAFSRVAPKAVAVKGGATHHDHAYWRDNNLQLAADDSDIESDVSLPRSPPRSRHTRPTSSNLSVLPLSGSNQRDERVDQEAHSEEDERHVVHTYSLRDSGLYSHSPSNNGEDPTTMVETDAGASRKLRLVTTSAAYASRQEVDRDPANLVISPSAVSVRMEASDEHNSDGLHQVSPLREEMTVSDTRVSNQAVRVTSSRPVFLARSRESRLRLLKSGGVERFAEIATKELQQQDAVALGLQAFPITSVEQTTGNSFISRPYDPRIIGKVIKTKAGSIHQVELHRPSDGPFGFTIAKGTVNDKSAIYVAKFKNGQGHPEKFFTGLLGVGDKIVAANGVKLKKKSIDSVHEIMQSSDKLLLTVKPRLLSSDW
ncbi:uncharacterized protein LOC134190593 [Corticium candelabrum]|uniref:uncharacterized protein LOC134190593 n=1 Tax=Corticium candelabrum TaxID=121492 RepID=UPI002E2558A0|nr:uncharacterized protein LOC134190593 [Corticium candelabrum]